MAMKRQLMALLSADVQGYSTLMSDNEEATIRTLTTYRSLMTQHIRKHHGRVVDTTGDNILAAFSSVTWLTDKSQPHYFSSRFLVLKAETGLATHGILLFRCHRGFGVRFTA